MVHRTSGVLLFYLFYQSRLGQFVFDSITGLNVQRMVGRRQDLFQKSFKSLQIPYQSAGCVPLLAPHLSSVALVGLCLLLLGDMREAFQTCALHMRGSYSTGQVSVQAQGRLSSVKTSRPVIFSSSAYRN